MEHDAGDTEKSVFLQNVSVMGNLKVDVDIGERSMLAKGPVKADLGIDGFVLGSSVARRRALCER